MKKLILKVLVISFALASCLSYFAGCAKRSETLKILNWGEYMDEDVLAGFEDWYSGHYDRSVKVVYVNFTSNEEVYVKIHDNKESWDLVCPSDYMIDRMIKDDILEKIDTDFLDIADSPDANAYVLEKIKLFDKNLEYTMPYMWGTIGIMYDTGYIDTPERIEKMNSWEALWDEEFAGHVYMKNQIRESYALTSIYLNREKLSEYSDGFTNYADPEYKKLLQDIFTKYGAEDFGGKDPVSAAKEALVKQGKEILYKFESDEGKSEMSKGGGRGKLGLFWSCDAGYVMANGDFNSFNLGFTVPKEGSNVWFDGWVIPKTSKNTHAANAFLEYLYDEENSIKNSAYSGVQTINKTAMDAWFEELLGDEETFEGAPEGFKEMYIDLIFPSEEVLSRCEVMGDFGDKYTKMKKMWIDVKLLIGSK